MPATDDYLVEVRDRTFARQGQIAYEYLDLKFVEVFRGVGSWELKLPAEHPLLPVLKAKGSGIVVTQRSSGRVFSGRTKSCVLSQSADDPAGTWIIKGVDDGVLAQATVVYPNPAQAANAQTSAYWTGTGTGEYLMKQLVRRNAGDLALASRKYAWLTSATDLGRGSSVPASLRFDVLGEALTTIGAQTGLGWTFYQSGSGVVFDVYAPADKTGLVRLDIRNGGLDSTELGYSAPSATKVLVLGQGEGAARTVREVTASPATADAALWGLNWELTKDQRNTNVTAELDAAGAEILTAQGVTVNSLRVMPSDAPGQRLGADWYLGDQVTVTIDGSPAAATVTQVATSITSAGVIQQATVGDPVGFDWDARVTAKVTQHEERLNAVENLVGSGYATPADLTALLPAGVISPYAGASAPSGYKLCDGASYATAAEPALFAAIGYTYGGAGANFNVPNLKGRVPVGIDAGQSEFDVRGETGGAKTHTLALSESPSHWHAVGYDGSNDGTPDVLATQEFSSPTYAGWGPNVGMNTSGGVRRMVTDKQGGGGAHNNLQPYVALHYIIKA